MKIVIDRETKIALLKALQTNELDTDEIPALKKVLRETRPDIWLSNLSDEQLNDEIAKLEEKMRK